MENINSVLTYKHNNIWCLAMDDIVFLSEINILNNDYLIYEFFTIFTK